MFGLIFRLVALAGLMVTAGVIALIAVAGFVLIDGGADPPDCGNEAAGTLAAATQSLTFDAKLATFLAAGGRAGFERASFTEGEVAARAERYFEDRTDRISGIHLCFEEGIAEGFVRFETILGRKLGVGGKGSLDLSGRHPRLDLTGARVAGIPLPRFLRRTIEDGINGELEDVVLLIPLDLTFTADEAAVSR